MRFITIVILSLVSEFCVAEKTSFTQYQSQYIKSISVVAPEWEGYTHKDGSGLYWDILRAIYEPSGIKVKTRIVPWNRALKMVSKYRTYNAIIGEYRDSEENVIFPSFPIDVEHLSLLSKKSYNHPWDGLHSLTNKRVGWIKGFELIVESKRDFKLKEFRDIEEGIKMLNAGKIDFIIDISDEVMMASQTFKLSKEEYSINEFPVIKDIYTAFSDDNLSRALIEIYNQRIPKLVASGELAAIYEKWDTGVMPDMLKKLVQQ